MKDKEKQWWEHSKEAEAQGLFVGQHRPLLLGRSVDSVKTKDREHDYSEYWRKTAFKLSLFLDPRIPIWFPCPCPLYKTTEVHIIATLLHQYWGQFPTHSIPIAKAGCAVAAVCPEDSTHLSHLLPQLPSVRWILTNSLFTCLTKSWTQNAVMRCRVSVSRRQMIEPKKAKGNIKGLWKETKQRWENYLF